MLQGVIGSISWADLLLVGLSVVDDFGGHGDGVLGDFLVILCTDELDAVTGSCRNSGSNFLDQ